MNKSVDFSEFVVDPDDSMARRVASFLDWAAVKMPGRAIRYVQIAKVVNMLSPRSRIGEKDARVKAIRNAMNRAKPILMNEFHRGVVSAPGYGVRATVDADDLASTQYSQDAKRVTSSIKALDRTRALIRPSEITDKDLRSRVNNVNGVVKLLVSNNVLARLLPEKRG